MAKTEGPTRLDDAQVAEILELLPGADSVELKLTVPEPAHRSTIDALEIDPLDAQIRQVYFFDTPDLALNRHGVVARARRIQGRAHDSVVKLRPVRPEHVSGKGRSSLVVEVDAMPGGFVCSASCKGKLDRVVVRQAVRGHAPLRTLFSKQQRRFFTTHAPDGIELDDLAVLGPIFVLKLKLLGTEFPRPLVAEMWLYPDGSRILELSAKCGPSEMFQVAAEARAFLHGRGVDLSGEQQTKTRTALEFFAGALTPSGA